MSRVGTLQTTTAKVCFEVEVTCEVDFDGNIIVDRIEAIMGRRNGVWLQELLATEKQISPELDRAIARLFESEILHAAAEAEDTRDADRADYERDMRRDDTLIEGVAQ